MKQGTSVVFLFYFHSTVYISVFVCNILFYLCLF